MILKFCSVVYSMLWWRDDNNLTIGNELINWSIIRTSPISRFHKLHCTEKPMRLAHRSRDDEIVIDRSCCFERYRLLDHQPADFLSSKIEWFIFCLHAMTSTSVLFQLYEQHRFCIESRDKRCIFFWWNRSKQNKSIYKAELSMFTCNTYGAKPSDHIIILIFIWISLSHKNE